VRQAIEARGVTFRYPNGWTLGPVDLVAPRAMVTALIGPNGAGKTTLLRILGGLVRPFSGACLLDGKEVADRWELARRVALAPTEPAFPTSTTVADVLKLRADTVHVPKAEVTAAERQLEHRLGCSLCRRPSTLSRGQRLQCSITLALLGSPEFVLADEPWSGLDPLAMDEVLGRLKEVSRAGASVVVSSHDLHQLPVIADRFVVLVGGRVRAAGSLEEIQPLVGGSLTDPTLILKELYRRSVEGGQE